MEELLLVVGLMLAAVVLVGVGDRWRLPWPALMVVLGAAVAFVPGLPDAFALDPELILPLFLPPLLFATAQRTSWAVFRARWRTIAFLAVGLVVATVVVVAGTAAALVSGIGVTAAVALGAMVASPDPVAVEAVAGPVHMPRRLLAVLESEGLFNDATALVIFQAAVLATLQRAELSAVGLLVRFLGGALAAVALGLAVAWLARWVTSRVTDTTSRSALTLVLPFATYLAADAVGASGVVAVVVVALQTRAASGADEAEERLVQRSFWDVVEMLVTGVAFGLIGIDLRSAAAAVGPALPTVLGHAAVVVAVAVAVRAVWMTGAWLLLRHSPDATSAPRTLPEAVVLTWCGMRGLATLALALSLPATTADGAAFPVRAELVVIAATVLVVTLLLPGFTLPWLVGALGVAADADSEHAAERAIAQRARKAALDALADEEKSADLPTEAATALHDRISRLGALLRGDPQNEEDRERIEELRRHRHTVNRIQDISLAAARAEVLAARREPGVDPEAAAPPTSHRGGPGAGAGGRAARAGAALDPEAVDRVLRRLDLRTVLLD